MGIDMDAERLNQLRALWSRFFSAVNARSGRGLAGRAERGVEAKSSVMGLVGRSSHPRQDESRADASEMFATKAAA